MSERERFYSSDKWPTYSAELLLLYEHIESDQTNARIHSDQCNPPVRIRKQSESATARSENIY